MKHISKFDIFFIIIVVSMIASATLLARAPTLPSEVKLGNVEGFILPQSVMEVNDEAIVFAEPAIKYVYVESKECEALKQVKEELTAKEKADIAWYYARYPSNTPEPIGVVGQRAWQELREYNKRHGDPLIEAAIEKRQQQDAEVQRAINEGRMTDSGEIK